VYLNFREKLVKCYIWNVALHGAKIWTLSKVDRKYLESFEMWCWRMENFSWTDCVRNKEIQHRVKKDRHFLHTIKRRKTNCTGHILRRKCLLKHVTEGRI
jgi:hypothetical protein